LEEEENVGDEAVTVYRDDDKASEHSNVYFW
jgi:hypothetical protein